MKLKSIHADVWIGALLILLSAIFYVMAGSFSNPGAAVWPKAILIGIILLSSLLVVQGLKLTIQKTAPAPASKGRLMGPAISLFCIVLYAVLMSYTGYFLSTAVFLPVGMFGLGQRNLKAILGVTAGLELFVYLLFVVQLRLRMP